MQRLSSSMPPSNDYSSDEAADSVHHLSSDGLEDATEGWARSLETVTHVLLAAMRLMLEKLCQVYFLVDALTIKHGIES